MNVYNKNMKQSQSEKAYEIAKRAHLGQIDKAGEDYIKHPERWPVL